MPKISLRAYNREISNLIDRGQTDEAVAHCQYILQTYPKHLESYRLLGKSYLEAHRYSEAIDIFQRVLAVVPDDFITHVGMSIIRNDENNLDAAIWHMERAFEVAPSNQAIQDELKHLYGRRDGQEPTKIRLTRGALCRMYVRGNQTRQAIAEIKSILAETPDRIDIEVLLARMYYLSNMTNEAVDLARKILEKIPYCYDTNKLMIEILTSAKKVQDTDPYKQKIVALDPYEGLISDPSSSVDQVPDDAITVDRLYYDPATQPTRAAQAVQAPPPSDQEESAPDWLISDLTGADSLAAQGFTRILDSSVVANEPEEEEPSATQPVSTEPLEEEPLPSWLQDAEQKETPSTQDAPIPDFLKATGWAEAGTIQEDTPPSESYPIEEPQPEGEIVPGDIPDWLQTMAPPETEASAAEKKDDFTDWLSKLDASPATLQQTGILSDEKIEEPTPAPAVPDWLNQVDETVPAEEPVQSAPSAEPAGELPDWLSDIGKNLSATAPLHIPDESKPLDEIPTEKPTIPQPKATGSLKFAVDDNFPSFGGTSILSPDDVPDWLQDLEPSTQSSTTNASDVFSSTSSLPQNEPAHSEVPQETITTKLTPEDKDEVPEWLKDISGTIQNQEMPSIPPVIEETPQELATMKLTPEEKMEMPEWLTEIQNETIPEPAAEPEQIVDERKTATLPEEEREEVEQMPEWLHLLEQEGPEVGTEPVAEVKPADTIQPQEPAPFDFSTFETAAESEKPATEEMPDFLSSAGFIFNETAADATPAVTVPAEETPAIDIPDFVQPVVEESAPFSLDEIFAQPEPAQEPESLEQIAPEPVLSEEVPAVESLVIEETSPEPVLMEEIEPTAPMPEEILPEMDFANPNIADFISPEMEETEVKDKPTTSILPPNPEDAAEEMPEWLREIDNATAEGTSPVELPEAIDSGEFPDWLKSYPATSVVDTPLEPEQPLPEPVNTDEVPAWLQDMTTLESAESADLNLPDWLNDIQAVTEPTQTGDVEPAAVVLPEWLVDEVTETEPVDQLVESQVAEEQEPELLQPEAEIEEKPELQIEEALPVEVEPALPESAVVEETIEIPAMEEPAEAVEEAVETVQSVESTWIPEEGTSTEEPSDWEMRVLRGTQALPEEQALEPNSFAVPSDSILADDSAAAAAAAIGIPLFAREAGGTEGLVSPEEAEKPEAMGEETEEEIQYTEESESISAPITSMEPEQAEETLAVSEELPVTDETLISDQLVEEAFAEALISEPEKALDEIEVADESLETETVEPIFEKAGDLGEVAISEVEETVYVVDETISPEELEEAAVLEPVLETESPKLDLMEEAVGNALDEIMVEGPEVAAEPSEQVEEPIVAEEVSTETAIQEEPVPAEEMPEPVLSASDFDSLLSQASDALNQGDIETSTDALNQVIQSEQKLPEVIQLVSGAIDRNPTDFSLWMTLGDAYGRNGDLQKALDAYIKAEEYLH